MNNTIKDEQAAGHVYTPGENVKRFGLKHVAFIMDGNGRWALARGLQRPQGHIEGMKTFDRVMNYCFDIGIRHVTAYAFSTENWKRPKREINTIMSLLSKYIDKGVRELELHQTAYHFIGDKSQLTDKLRMKAENLEKISAHYPNTLNIALNYGSRQEITRACNNLIAEGKTKITVDDISSHLYTSLSPDPDMLVRTGGEYRISNYLLWQLSYTELYFTDILWPDLKNEDIDNIVIEYGKRNRRFGGLNPDAENTK